jgi:thiaminase/transcriptional activator TenA
MATNRLYDQLKEACATEWDEYTRHDFVLGIADGSLQLGAFRFYLVQDFLFLKHFARAYALAVYKADHLEDMRAAAGSTAAILGETGVHLKYCADWGLDEADIIATPEAPETTAYTRFVLERGMAGDLLDLHVALSPCAVGYAEIGRLIVDEIGPTANNPYQDWIDVYSGDEFGDGAASQVAMLDRQLALRGGPGRFDGLVETFRTATRLERDFWQMGLNAAEVAG